ncbi:hypothetical protein [Tessaracoccus aquimaris]|nr:hypothetical protein [Tessaracoccus aquimaris]
MDDVNQTDAGGSNLVPLNRAAAVGDVGAVRTLLARGARPDVLTRRR